MENILEDMLLLKSKNERKNSLNQRNTIKSVNSPSKHHPDEVDPLSHHPDEVDPLFDVPFSEIEVVTKHKIDDFIDKDEFRGLTSEGSSSDHGRDYTNEEHITIVPDAFCGSVKETRVISDDVQEPHLPTNFIKSEIDIDEENLNSIFVHDSIITEDEPLLNDDVYADTFYEKEMPLIHKKKKSANSNSSYSIEIEVQDPSNKEGSVKFVKDLIKSGKNSNGTQIKVDKNDPRSRLHFVKFIKKDGKTRKIVECGLCGKEFLHQYILMRHLTTHTDERNFKCTVCGKSFRQMSTLAQHRVTHVENRPYVCDICQKSFTRVSALLCHKKIHDKNKPYVCQVCGKGFHQKGNLKNHFFTHTNERPYKCDICGRGFNQASNVTSHKIKHHQKSNSSETLYNNRFKCSLCDHFFARKAQLRRHEELVHGVRITKAGTQRLTGPSSKITSTNILKKRHKAGIVETIQISDNDKVSSKEDLQPTEEEYLQIDPIDTKEMQETLAMGGTPFALLKPLDEEPILVEIRLDQENKHILVPASFTAMKEASQISFSNAKDGVRSIQIKVPMVAIIHQRIDEDGETVLQIENVSKTDRQQSSVQSKLESSPEPDILEEELIHSTLHSSELEESPLPMVQHFISDNVHGDLKEGTKDSSQGSEENVLVLPADEDKPNHSEWHVIDLDISSTDDQIEYIIPPEHDEQLIEIGPPTTQDHSMQLTNENINVTLKNATPDKKFPGIQYLRHGLEEFEVVEDDQEIVATTSDKLVQQQGKSDLDENASITIDPAHLRALVTALQSAGYQLRPDGEDRSDDQAMFHSSRETIILHEQVDCEQVQMVIGESETLGSTSLSFE